jgi:hypothetical protein
MSIIDVHQINMENTSTDSQSLSNSFEGVHGVVRKSNGVSYFCGLLHFMTKFLKSFEAVHQVPSSSPLNCVHLRIQQGTILKIREAVNYSNDDFSNQS